MLNGIEFQTVGAAYLKALRPTAVLMNGTYRKLEIRSVERGICPIATFTMNELFSYNYGA